MGELEAFADKLNGSEYGHEGSRELWAEMKAAGIVAVFGASDDLMEFRGAIYDEASFYGSGTAYVTPEGLFEDCDAGCKYAKSAKASATPIKALWCAPGEPSWTYQTGLPHATFDVMEDGEVYCRGIVFSLNSLATTLHEESSHVG
jgi:hypothetical protein